MLRKSYLKELEPQPREIESKSVVLSYGFFSSITVVALLPARRFKQDFIVNVGSLNKEFVLYTADTNGNETTYLKHINAFFSKYGKKGHYNGTHWVEFDKLPEEVKPRANDAIRLAGVIKQSGTAHITQDRIDGIYRQYQELKSTGQKTAI